MLMYLHFQLSYYINILFLDVGLRGYICIFFILLIFLYFICTVRNGIWHVLFLDICFRLKMTNTNVIKINNWNNTKYLTITALTAHKINKPKMQKNPLKLMIEDCKGFVNQYKHKFKLILMCFILM